MRTLLLTGEYTSYVTRTNSRRHGGSAENRRFPGDSVSLSRRVHGPLEPSTGRLQPGPEDPPLNVTNMTSVILDSRGVLMQFIAVPPQYEPPAASSPRTTDWQPLFDAAVVANRAVSTGRPAVGPVIGESPTSARHGRDRFPESPDVRVHVDVAASRGRPTFFRTDGTVDRYQVVRWFSRPRYPFASFRRSRMSIFLVPIVGPHCSAGRTHARTSGPTRRGSSRRT